MFLQEHNVSMITGGQICHHTQIYERNEQIRYVT